MKIKWILFILILCIIVAGCSKGKKQVGGDDLNDSLELIDHTLNIEEAIEEEPELNEPIEEEPVVEAEDHVEADAVSMWFEKYGFEIGNNYIIHGETNMYDLPERIAGIPAIHRTKPGEMYIFEEINEDEGLVKVKTADRNGWLSLWYFTDEAELVLKEDPYEMIVLEPITFSFYPNEEEPYGIELSTGKVVQVEKSYGEWVSVFALFGDAEFLNDKWVKKEKLMGYDPNFATEGVLKLGGKVYNEEGKVKLERSGFPLWIHGEEGVHYSFSAPGGLVGYIRKEDFVPNPFVTPVLTMRFIVNVGMDADYLVEELTANEVTHRYFDYQHHFEPDEETNTVAFEEMLEIQDGQRVYSLELLLSYPTTDVLLKPTDEFMERVETNPEFRKQLGLLLGKPIFGVPHDLKLTTEIIEQNI